jgi:hypothetical protein
MTTTNNAANNTDPKTRLRYAGRSICQGRREAPEHTNPIFNRQKGAMLRKQLT